LCPYVLLLLLLLLLPVLLRQNFRLFRD